MGVLTLLTGPFLLEYKQLLLITAEKKLLASFTALEPVFESEIGVALGCRRPYLVLPQ
jgi:hypothetical protein